MPAGKVAPAAKNKLVVRVQRRIVVELGDLDAVFAAANTVQGKKQRLQALGYYYEPLTAAAPNTPTEAYTRCLESWRKRREQKTGRKITKVAEIAKELQIHVRAFVVDKGKLPAVGGERRVRVPGALTFSVTNDLGDGGVADGTALASIRFNDENALWTANPTLGQIPLVVTVQKKVKGKWQPALVHGGEHLHEAVLVDGLVANRGDHESEHSRRLGELLDHLDRSLRVADRQVCHRPDPRAGGEHVADQPPVVCTTQLDLVLRLWMSAERQHRRREEDRIVDRHLVHRVEKACR